MKVICKDRRRAAPSKLQTARGMSSVTPEIDRLLGPKTHEQLEALEKQVKAKLRSNDDIDVDYWENLLKSLSIYKAKARLRQVSKSVLGARLETLRQQQEQEAMALRNKVRESLKSSSLAAPEDQAPHTELPATLDPEPLLRLNPEDKTLISLDEDDYKQRLVCGYLMYLNKFYADHMIDSRSAQGPQARLHPSSSWYQDIRYRSRSVFRT
jgi:hypothetical protein